MLSLLLKRFSGRHYKKFLEKVRPTVARINELEKSYQALTDEQLRAKTDEFRARIAAATDKKAALEAVLPVSFESV
jgi:preprotein translocase subunit SecA